MSEFDLEQHGRDMIGPTDLPTEEDRRAAYKWLYINAMTDVGVPEHFAAETFEAGGEPDYLTPPDEAAQNEMDCWE